MQSKFEKVYTYIDIRRQQRKHQNWVLPHTYKDMIINWSEAQSIYNPKLNN